MHTHQVWGACGDCFEDGGGLALAMGSMVVMIMVRFEVEVWAQD